jgi:DNA-binding response OmpR family regulator
MNKRKRILIADNDEYNLEFLELMLSKLGFDVEKAEAGPAALEKIRQKKADFALINTILPGMSGWEILKTVKADAQCAAVQVIMLSDIDNVKEKVECYELGAEDYITKPLSFSVLLAKIRSAIRNKELYFDLGRQSLSNNTLQGEQK